MVVGELIGERHPEADGMRAVDTGKPTRYTFVVPDPSTLSLRRNPRSPAIPS